MIDDGELIITKALGVSVRFVAKYHGYGVEDDERYMVGEILIGDTVIFSADMTTYAWSMDGRQEQAVEALLREFRNKINGEAG